MTWERIYDFLGIKDFIYFVNSDSIQDVLFPVKLAFILFAAFFFCALIYLYVNSSYLKYKFLEDLIEFFAWEAYGSKELNRRWRAIIKRTDTGSEKEYKLAIMEADDFLKQVLEDADFQGKNMEELVKAAGRRVVSNTDDILAAHQVRNVLVYDVNYKLDANQARKILQDYEKAIKGASALSM